MRMKPASTTSAGSWRSISACSAASNASRSAKALWSTTAVAMPASRAVCRPLASGRLLTTAATRAPRRCAQRSRPAARTMAAMLLPVPEIRMTMFFILAGIILVGMTDLRPLTPIEARVLGTLMEKARTVPDTYPLSLNLIVTGCNQKTSREPVMNLREAQVAEALDDLRRLSLVIESQGGRVAKYEHNLQRMLGVPEQSAVLLGLLMLRGPQTAAELRLNAERWYRFADISSVEGFLNELAERAEEKGGTLILLLLRAPGAREARWAHMLCGTVTTQSIAASAHPSSAGGTFDAQSERIARLESELAALSATVARLCAELGVSPDGPTNPPAHATTAR